MTADPSILDPRVRAALDTLPIDYEPLPCEEHLADTAEFCAHYGISPDEACNAIIVAVKTSPRSYLACLVRADTRLDVNKKLSTLVGTKKLSFASSEETADLTGMRIGGVTLIGLPATLPIYIDTRVMTRPRIILGGGNRTSKIRLNPKALQSLPNARVEDIANER